MDLVRASLAEQLSSLRGVGGSALPAPLLDVIAQRVELTGCDLVCLRPADWEALREAEAAESRPVPWWARLWPSGLALARALAERPPAAGARVLELGCGLALPSAVAARAGGDVLATDGSTDAVAFAAHCLALNELDGEVAHADWSRHGDALAARGHWDLILAADVFYTRPNIGVALRLLPRLLAPQGTLRLADPGRSGARDFLAAARGTFSIATERRGDVRLHTLRRRSVHALPPGSPRAVGRR